MGCGAIVISGHERREQKLDFGCKPRVSRRAPAQAQRAMMQSRHARPGGDRRVLQLLDYLEWLEAELVRVLSRAEAMEARLVRRPRLVVQTVGSKFHTG